MLYMGQHAHFLCARDHVQPPLMNIFDTALKNLPSPHLRCTFYSTQCDVVGSGTVQPVYLRCGLGNFLELCQKCSP